MPPFVSRKRHASSAPPEQPETKKTKPTDASGQKTTAAVKGKRRFAEPITSSDDSSLSDDDSDDFEDVMPERRRDEEEGEDDEMDWEDALHTEPATATTSKPRIGGDLQLTLEDPGERAMSYTDGKKKGPSKLDRQKRNDAHRMHVQFLMFHNAIRNAWACDKKTHEILVAQLPAQVSKVVEDWRRNCGDALKKKKEIEQSKSTRTKGQKSGKKGKGKQQQRDWGGSAQRLEEGVVNISHGDPIIRLLKYLAKYWQKKFQITAPGLRKQGHKPVRELQKEIASFRKDKHDPEKHGERIMSIREFRMSAKRCEGSRDLGAQLFTALLRGVGVEARMVASLQPTGFGWNRNEEATSTKSDHQSDLPSEDERSDNEEPKDHMQSFKKASKAPKTATGKEPKPRSKPKSYGSKETQFSLSSDSELSELSSDSSESVVEIMTEPRKLNRKKYDPGLKFPIYWTEAISPVSDRVYSVDAIVAGAPALNEELLLAFEPRGSKAEKAKQIIAYVVAHSDDGTAKDVTTRYLKRHMWPGKTKGVRLPAEKVPIYNKRGKIKRYEEYDWWKTVMSGYERHQNKRTRADFIEDDTDLKPATIEKKAVKEGEETLQYYRQSADYCLERLLRREEALRPGAKPVKTFTAGKGENVKEEPVYRRSDVLPCKTEESWHKEGRQPVQGAEPLKFAPYRAVTTSRKREIEELTRRNDGVKPLQGLYSRDQTEYIIPPPIENGVIPKNQFGNIDCFVPRMVPKGAVHVPYRGLVKLCKKLEIDFAEAVVGFEFGNRMAVPVIQGVIVAENNQHALLEAWEEEEARKKIREDEKRQAQISGTWRKYLMGLRILDNMRNQYRFDQDAPTKDAVNPFTNINKTKLAQSQPIAAISNSIEDMQGGFLRDEDEDEDEEEAGEGIGYRKERNFVEDLHIIDNRKDKQRNESIEGGGFFADTPEESSEKVFDDLKDESSKLTLSSLEEEIDSDLPQFKSVPPKQTLKRNDAKQAETKAHPSRRSARTSGQRSKYFESENGDESENEDEPSVGNGSTTEDETSQPRRISIAKQPQKPGKSQVEATKSSTGTPKGSRKVARRGRPRKTA